MLKWKIRSSTIVAGALAAAVVLPSAAFGQKLMCTKETHGAGFGYNDYRWDNFSAELDANFDSVTIENDMTDLNTMLQYDALMVQLRTFGGPGLSPTESDNLKAFLATGRRVLAFGENPSGWRSWNASLLAAMGGSDSGQEGNGTMTVANQHPPITDNVSSVEGPNTGIAVGGLSLFNVNFMTVWDGDGSQNGLTMLDVNVFEDDRWDTQDAAQLAANTAVWLAGGGSADCLTMEVDQLFAGQNATWEVSSATPGAEVAIVWGTREGQTTVNGVGGYCATFGIQGVNTKRVLCRKTADANGDVSCRKRVPGNASGLRVLTQAAERGTCPNECMSNLDDQVVQ